jgi:hypothetical protein
VHSDAVGPLVGNPASSGRRRSGWSRTGCKKPERGTGQLTHAQNHRCNIAHSPAPRPGGLEGGSPPRSSGGSAGQPPKDRLLVQIVWPPRRVMLTMAGREVPKAASQSNAEPYTTVQGGLSSFPFSLPPGAWATLSMADVLCCSYTLFTSPNECSMNLAHFQVFVEPHGRAPLRQCAPASATQLRNLCMTTFCLVFCDWYELQRFQLHLQRITYRIPVRMSLAPA